MARTIELEVQVDGLDKINKDIRSLEGSLEQMKGQLQGLGKGSPEFEALSNSIKKTEGELEKLTNQAKEASKEQMSLNQQIGEAEDKLMLMAQAGQQGTEAYQKLLVETGKMKKVQMETNVQIDRAAAGFTGKLTVGVQRVAAAYQVGMAATQMFGVESEKAQAIMAKLQAVMAFTQGIEQLKQLTVGMKLFGDGGFQAMSAIKKGLISTGIGALVVAIGTLVAYWDDIMGLVKGVSAEQEKVVETAKENVSVAEEQMAQFSNQENSLRLQGKSEKEILELRLKRIDAVIAEQETYIAAMEQKAKLEVEAAKRNQEITKMIIRIGLESAAFGIRMLAAPIDAVIETANAVAEVLGFNEIVGTNLNELISEGLEAAADYGSKYFFDPAEVEKKNNDLIKAEKNKLDKLKSDRDGLKLQIKQIEEQEVANSVAKAKEREEKLRALREESLAIIKDMEARRIAAIDEQNALEIEKLDDTEKAKAKLQLTFDGERQALIDKANAGELEALDEKFVSGKIKEEEYLAEVRKLRQDDSRLNEQERKLLLTKEGIKNDAILKIETDANQKKQEERDKFNKYRLSQETDEFQKLINNAQEAYNNDLKQLQDFLKNKTISQEEYDEEVKKRAEKLNADLEAINKQARDKELDRLKGAFSTIAGAFESLKQGTTGVFASIASGLSSGLGQLMEIGKMKFDEFDTQLQNTAQKVNAYAQAIGGMLQSVLGAVSDEQQQRLEENLANVEETYNAETAALEQSKAQGLITEEQFAQQKYQIDLKRYNAEEAARKKAFEQEKGLKIASAIISGLQGAVAAFAGAMQLGPIAGPIVGGILAGVVGAMTAVNVAQIAATQYKGGTPPSAPSIAGGAEGAGSQVSGAMTAPQVSQTTLFGQAMTGGNQGGQNQEMGQRQQPMRAYVLETDITTSQNTISTYEQRAEIG